jgi:2-C-methyl-D-erythritol 4-phosphate cytidylyltransferase
MKKFAIIVAGGSGNRMGADIPKQFLPIKGKPILIHTIDQFMQIADIEVIVVLPKKDIAYWESQNFVFPKPVKIVIGGTTRFQSVKNGLASITIPQGLVAVHDGVRPFVTQAIIQKGFEVANEKGSAVTCVPMKDSIREVGQLGINKAADRSRFRLIQTPQTFDLANMKKAFETSDEPFFTDCASVMEHSDFAITLIDGAYENIKITTPEDLVWAEAFLKN